MLSLVLAAHRYSSRLEIAGSTTVKAVHARHSVQRIPQGAPCKLLLCSSFSLIDWSASVTVVGATQGTSPDAAADFSSGGFSNVFAQPDYQTDAVGNYLSTLGSTNSGLFNTQGRGYPDVSAAGVAYQVNIGGDVQPVSGTSASAPLFASIVALLNDRLVAAGQSTMGFLNPMLYSNGLAALDDVTQGNNPGCGTDGFPAASGWDPVRDKSTSLAPMELNRRMHRLLVWELLTSTSS